MTAPRDQMSNSMISSFGGPDQPRSFRRPTHNLGRLLAPAPHNIRGLTQRQFSNATAGRTLTHVQTSALLHGFATTTYKIYEKEYKMQVPHADENIKVFDRHTADGRALRYILEVEQQPERARACGNGTKSIQDRRPIDPPPVVRLKIQDRHTGEEVTPEYCSGMMCYASIVHSRPIDNGSFYGQPADQPVTLYGNTVAAGYNLTTPTTSIYFIFPDLSINYEGFYRLKFDLFEQIRHDNDMDYGMQRPFTVDSTLDNPQPPQAADVAINRGIVYSAPFQAWSAKKFPGLLASSELDKALADAGCRVRLRKQARSRKIDEVKGKAPAKPKQQTLAAIKPVQPAPQSVEIDGSDSDSANDVLAVRMEGIYKDRNGNYKHCARPVPYQAPILLNHVVEHYASLPNNAPPLPFAAGTQLAAPAMSSGQFAAGVYPAASLAAPPQYYTAPSSSQPPTQAHMSTYYPPPPPQHVLSQLQMPATLPASKRMKGPARMSVGELLSPSFR